MLLKQAKAVGGGSMSPRHLSSQFSRATRRASSKGAMSSIDVVREEIETLLPLTEPEGSGFRAELWPCLLERTGSFQIPIAESLW
jgi:hypothetical protein